MKASWDRVLNKHTTAAYLGPGARQSGEVRVSNNLCKTTIFLHIARCKVDESTHRPNPWPPASIAPSSVEMLPLKMCQQIRVDPGSDRRRLFRYTDGQIRHYFSTHVHVQPSKGFLGLRGFN